MQHELPDLVGPVALREEFLQAAGRKAGVVQHPLERRGDRDLFGFGGALGFVNVFRGRQVQGEAGELQRRPKLLRQTEGGDRRDRFEERLEFLEGGVGPFDGFLHVALDVLAEQSGRSKQRSEGSEMILEGGSQQVRGGPRQLAQAASSRLVP